MEKVMFVVWDQHSGPAIFFSEQEARDFKKEMETKTIEDNFIDIEDRDLQIIRTPVSPDIEKFYYSMANYLV